MNLHPNTREARKASPRGFTLVELLVVISLIAVVSGMVVGLFGSAVEKSGATVSMATQKQLLNQISAYKQLHGNTLPNNFDSLTRSNNDNAFSTDYTTIGTYRPTGHPATEDLNIGNDLTTFFLQDQGVPSDPQYANRGVHPEAYLGADRTLTVKQITQDDLDVLTSLGITALHDLRESNLSHGEHRTSARTLALGDPIVIIDPQSVAGQQLYRELGVDLSDDTVFTRNGSDDTGTAWDDTFELDAAGRLEALTTEMFYVFSVGLNSDMVGSGLAGVQEPPASAVVSQGYYNRFSLVLKKGASSSGDRNAGVAGVIDPRGRGAGAAREVVNSIQ